MLVKVTVELSEDIAKRAHAAGLLSNERVEKLFIAELQRQAAWDQFKADVASVQAAAQSQFAGVSEDALRQVIASEIEAARSANATNDLTQD